MSQHKVTRQSQRLILCNVLCATTTYLMLGTMGQTVLYVGILIPDTIDVTVRVATTTTFDQSHHQPCVTRKQHSCPKMSSAQHEPLST